MSAVLLAGLVCKPVAAQRQAEEELTTHPVAKGIHLVMGGGGNVAVCVGDDGVFVIDDKLQPVSKKLRAAISQISDAPIRFVLNTHWHGDHTGGNQALASEGAILVAHENVRTRMSEDQFNVAFKRKTPASPRAAWPIVTFERDITFHLNGFEIEARHVDPAHTDGDAIVFFSGANVIHMGDTYFNGFYPYIDTGTGGAPKGMIAAADLVLERSDGDTKIIPGHGPLSNRRELQAYRDMLDTVRQRIAALVSAGKTRDEVVASKPTADFDARWGGGFLSPDLFTRIVYEGVKAE
jgi:cyclase